MMEKFFSFMSFYEQHQQAAPAQSTNSDNNNGVTPMSLDGSSFACGNQQPMYCTSTRLCQLHAESSPTLTRDENNGCTSIAVAIRTRAETTNINTV
ncbi:unnamed protein product [Closterium sp. NIES-54]